MNYHQDQSERSYAEVRFLVFFTAGFFLLALGLGLLWALDTNGDNLDDSWEAQYGITTNAYASTNLVGWWQLNGTNNTDKATDRSGNGINGTLRGFPSVAYRQGLFSNALYFTTNASVSFPTTNSALSVTNQFTFSGWFRTTNNLTQPATLATWSDGHTNSWSVGVATNGIARISFANTNSTQTVMATNNGLNLYDGNWHAVAATYATNQVATVYVDGTGEATNTITNWTPSAVSSFTFGTTNTNVVMNPYILDEARLYNRAMSATEVPQLPVTYSDLNGSGLNVYQDYLEGLNPFSTGTIVTTGFINSGLTGYYGSSAPTLTKTGGDNQIVSASTFETNPLVVQVKNSSGTALVGAPITFTIPSGSDGGVALTSGGTTTTSLSLVTDSSGNATVYYQSGPDTLKNNTITATAVYTTGSVSVNFTAYCGVQSGLTLWLKADMGVSTSGSNVTSWTDQRGNYNVSPNGEAGPTYVTNDINGKPGVRFSGSQSLYNSSNIGLNADLTMVVVGASSNRTKNQVELYLGGISSNTTSRGMGYVNGYQSFTGFGDDVSGGAAPNVNTFTTQIVTLNASKNSINFYLNGSANGSPGIAGLNNIQPGITIGTIHGYSQDYHTVGDIAEVLVYDHQLSSTDLQQVGAYLADKYGLYHPNATWPQAYSTEVQGEITRNQWNKSQADLYVAMENANPTMLTHGLVHWLKADAMGASYNNGDTVNSWVDQTGNYNVSPNGEAGPTYVTNDINGKPGVRFSGSQSLYNPSNLGLNADLTMVVVGASSNRTKNQVELYLGGISSNTTSRGMGYVNGYQSFTGFGDDVTGGAAPNVNTFTTQIVTLNASKNSINFYLNGSANGSPGIAGLNNIQPGITIGTVHGYSQDYHTVGDIAEVLIYDHQLSTAESQQVGAYLADKYGLYHPNATWPQAYSTEVQGEITRNQWNKSQADLYVAMENANPTMLTHGLVHWLKADAMGASYNNGDTVNSWVDQTGNYNVSPNGEAGPTYVTNDINGKPGVRFSGSQSLYNPSNLGLNADLTMVVVGASSNRAKNQIELYLGGLSNTTSRGMGYVNSNQFFTGFGDDVSGGAAPNVNTFTTQIVTLNASKNSINFYLNGGANGSPGIGGLNNIQPGITIGMIHGYSQDYHTVGDIAEVLIYDHQLSTAESQQVGVYLANKYNLAYTLPAPTITPNGGSFSSSTTVTISGAPSPAVIRYTLDGTMPTNNSTLYSGSFTLTQSAPVNCAIFLNNVEISPVVSAQFYVGDTGNIGISDAWQIQYFGHTGIDPAAQSPGGSGLTNLQAYLWGYNPTLFSTNGDGLSDETNHLLGYAATNLHISSDGLTNAQNLAMGLDPFGPNTLPSGLPPNPNDHTAPTITVNNPQGATLLP
jgi:hypothetical protein